MSTINRVPAAPSRHLRAEFKGRAHDRQTNVQNESITSAVGLDLFAWAFPRVFVHVCRFLCCCAFMWPHLRLALNYFSFLSYVTPVAEVSNHLSPLTRLKALKMLL